MSQLTRLDRAADEFRSKNNHSTRSEEVTAALFARALLDLKNKVQIDPNDMIGSLTNALKKVTPLTPVTGDTVSMNTDKKDETIVLTPAGTLAALTLVFPPDASSRIGQIERVISSQIVTALTVSAAGLTIRGTAVTALAADVPIAFEKIAAATWQRLA
jgi:uncharacterized protein YidB (DUF937 family)